MKALSNQKLFEMRARFGTERVGLQTGDASLNIESDIVVMTTEILRNMMYHVEEDGTTSDRLSDVGLVVLDEVIVATFGDLSEKCDCSFVNNSKSIITSQPMAIVMVVAYEDCLLLAYSLLAKPR